VLESGTFAGKDGEFSVPKGKPVEARSCQIRTTESPGCLTVPPKSLIETSAQIEDAFSFPDFSFSPSVSRVALQLPDPRETEHRSLRLHVGDLVRTEGVRGPLEFTPTALRELGEALRIEAKRLDLALARTSSVHRVLSARAGEEARHFWGIAVDIGTTTVAVVLVDLADGRLLRRAARYNAQIEKADDVASRISYSCRSPQALEELRRLVVHRTINPMIAELCRAQEGTTADVLRVAVSGNTVMMHLLMGISPGGIGRFPFRPVETHFRPVNARGAGFAVHPEAFLDIVPSVAGYVGGDIVSDLLLSIGERRDGNLLMIDIGTNGEIVLCTPKGMWACATAAGPAFEGHGTFSGCRAASGAIEHLAIDEHDALTYSTVGGEQPIGVCGTGLIDFIAEARRRGWLDRRGRFDVERLRALGRHTTIPAGNGVQFHGCIIAFGEANPAGQPIIVCEPDIAQVLKAKAAIYAGIRALTAECHLIMEDLDRLVLAGGFGRHINLPNAIMLGLLPDVPVERYEMIGNGSLGGACRVLLDGAAAAACDAIAREPQIVELNLIPNFEDDFIDAMMIPHDSEEEFPGVTAELTALGREP
jgi:uncharacterized 2Fe-2S/4Fe-4S cluster protein (DUF4445 family)